ncbi:MAG: rhodanese-like domain-containing protein [Deltaproteobacteria bacterium]|nr:rhodanese-like domain-containing protein [Deltaproteobacteria bacterium]
MPVITAAELLQQLRSAPPILIDVRSPDEFLYESIPAARSCPLDQLAVWTRELRPDAAICVVCQQGVRSAAAAEQLRALGFQRVVSLAGGIEAFRRASGTTVRQRRVLPLQRQVFLTIGSLLVLSTGLAQWVHAGFAWLGGAIGVGLLVAGATGYCGLAHVLSRMPWNRVRPGCQGDEGSSCCSAPRSSCC